MPIALHSTLKVLCMLTDENAAYKWMLVEDTIEDVKTFCIFSSCEQFPKLFQLVTQYLFLLLTLLMCQSAYINQRIPKFHR